MLTARISSVVSVSVARAEPSARRGMRPLVIKHCLAGPSPEQVHVRLSVVRIGTATVSTGMEGLYFATSLAVLPPRVNTTINAACTYMAMAVSTRCIFGLSRHGHKL
jgi:hypothetical protein